jgi:hypothetical protein
LLLLHVGEDDSTDDGPPLILANGGTTDVGGHTGSSPRDTSWTLLWNVFEVSDLEMRHPFGDHKEMEKIETRPFELQYASDLPRILSYKAYARACKPEIGTTTPWFMLGRETTSAAFETTSAL